MWIRVAHNWAGPGFGTFFLPRIGMEVLVEFLEGQPEQPLVVGCVYNGDNKVGPELPLSKTQSTIRTRSSPNSEGFNELRFEDAAGSEQVFLHAQKDLSEVVNNCHTTSVGVNQSISVGANQSTSVGANQSNSVSGDQSNSVSGNQSETISKDQTMSVTGKRTKTVTQDEVNTLEAKRTTSVGSDESLSVTGTTTFNLTGAVSMSCSDSFTHSVGGLGVEAGGAGDAKIGASNKFDVLAQTELALSQNGEVTLQFLGGTSKHSATTNIEVGAKAQLLLEGATKAQLGQGEGNGVVLEGGKISIQSPTEISLSAGGCTITLSAEGVSIFGPKVDVSSSGVTSVTGSVVKVN